MKQDKVISKFDGAYRFLSNFYPAPIRFCGVQFGNSEAAFHAQKCPERAAEFSTLNPSEAKRLGRRVPLRSDWESVKDEIMHAVVFTKFAQNPALLEKLLATGDAALEEGNSWGDRYWGVCDGIGQNKLGQILMQVRKELADNENFATLAPNLSKYEQSVGQNMAMAAICFSKQVGFFLPVVRTLDFSAANRFTPVKAQALGEIMLKNGHVQFALQTNWMYAPNFWEQTEDIPDTIEMFNGAGWNVVGTVWAPSSEDKERRELMLLFQKAQ